MNDRIKEQKWLFIQETAELVFKVLYLALALLAFNSLVAGSLLLKVLSYALTGFGAVLLLARAVRFKSFIQMPQIFVLFGFLLSFLISTLLNSEFGITENLQAFVWLTLQMGVLYACDCSRDPEKYKKELKILLGFFVAYIFLSNVISIGMFAANYGYLNHQNPFSYNKIGFIWGRLWGVYTDPNYGAVLNAASVVVCICGFKAVKSNLFKAFLALNIALDFHYIMFSDSRTGWVCASIGTVVCTYLLLLISFKKQAKGFMRNVLCMVLSVNLFLICLLVPQISKDVYNAVVTEVPTQGSSTSSSDPLENEKDPSDRVQLGRPEGETEDDISNRRFSLWQSGFEIWQKAPVFGTTHRNMTAFALKYAPETYLVSNNMIHFDTTHNMFIDILVSQGLVGILLILLFFTLTAIYLIRKIIKVKLDIHIILSVSILLVLSASSVFVLDLIYLNSAGAFLFWLCLGNLVYYLKVAGDRADAKANIVNI